MAVGRGATRRGSELQRIVSRCRERAARLLGAESPDRIIFTFNGTDGLNLALHGLLEPEDHVVTSVMEHNSVLRPLRAMRDAIGIEVSYVPADREGRIRPADVRSALTPKTKVVALTHASNVTGTLQQVEAFAEIAHEGGALLVIDAAQSAGHVPINASELGVDVLACSGHKGPLGPLGTGLVYVRPGVEARLKSLRQGGTGSRSEDDHQPDELPDKYESGNHNAPGLAGLEAGLAWIEERDLGSIRAHEVELTRQLLAGLRRIGSVRIYGPASADERTGVVSITIDGFEPQDVATILDENFGVEVRAGLHCAPRAHQAIGTFDGGGTVRMSVGPFTTEADVAAAIDALAQIGGG